MRGMPSAGNWKILYSTPGRSMARAEKESDRTRNRRIMADLYIYQNAAPEGGMLKFHTPPGTRCAVDCSDEPLSRLHRFRSGRWNWAWTTGSRRPAKA